MEVRALVVKEDIDNLKAETEIKIKVKITRSTLFIKEVKIKIKVEIKLSSGLTLFTMLFLPLKNTFFITTITSIVTSPPF